jgi:hypothetical protein
MSTPATEGATPSDGATPPADPSSQSTGATPSTDDDLGDAGKRALAELRRQLKDRDSAIADRDARLKALEDRDKTELERVTGDLATVTAERDELRAQVATFEQSTLKQRIAADAGIPQWWQRLHGATEEELLADAKQIADQLGAQPNGATPDLGAGARSGAADPRSGMDQLIRRGAGR